MEYDPASAIHFAEGIPGFESEQRFLVIQRPDQHPLVFLQSLETVSLCFPALPVHAIEPGYQPMMASRDLELLGFTAQPVIGKDAIFLALIAVHDNPTANLLAPVVVNLATCAAAQCVDAELRYSHRYSLIEKLERAS
jgi:flagellar assembly factor FliW